MLNCRAVAIKWKGCGGGRGFSSNLRIGVQSEMTLWNFGNLALKWGSLIKWRANLFFVLSVVLRCFGFLIIFCLRDKMFLEFHFFAYVPRAST